MKFWNDHYNDAVEYQKDLQRAGLFCQQLMDRGCGLVSVSTEGGSVILVFDTEENLKAFGYDYVNAGQHSFFLAKRVQE